MTLQSIPRQVDRTAIPVRTVKEKRRRIGGRADERVHLNAKRTDPLWVLHHRVRKSIGSEGR